MRSASDPAAPDLPSDIAPALTPQTTAPKKLKAVKTRSFATLRTIGALILREMSTTNGRSPGGYAWAILEPALGIAFLSLLFSTGFRSPPMGTNFPIFYATGLVPLLMFVDISTKVSISVLFSKQLLAYPAVTYIDAMVARFLLNLLTQLMVCFLIFTGILLIFETRTTPELDRIALGLTMTAALALGVGTINCFLISMFPVWQKIWSILTRPLVIMSCVFFLFDNVPDPYQGYLWYVPTVHLTGTFRAAFYPGYEGAYVSSLYVFGLSAVLTVLGLVFLRRYYRVFLYA